MILDGASRHSSNRDRLEVRCAYVTSKEHRAELLTTRREEAGSNKRKPGQAVDLPQRVQRLAVRPRRRHHRYGQRARRRLEEDVRRAPERSEERRVGKE